MAELGKIIVLIVGWTLLNFGEVLAKRDVQKSAIVESGLDASLFGDHENDQDTDLHSESKLSASTKLQQDAKLPSGAKWCRVKPCDGSPEFDMAVYAENDIVSNGVCEQGHWELCDSKQYHPATSSGGAGDSHHLPLMLDIGSNIGYYALLFANAGFDVVAVEPMPQNVALIEASLHANPHLSEHIHLHKLGLGAKAGDECVVMAEKINVGDGNVFCSGLGDMQQWIDRKKVGGHGYDIKGRFSVNTLDDLLQKESFVQSSPTPKFDYVKMDVEGFEGMVIKGGMSLLKTYTPRLLQSEVWPEMRGLESPDEFFDMFTSAGYNV